MNKCRDFEVFVLALLLFPFLYKKKNVMKHVNCEQKGGCRCGFQGTV